MEGQALLNWYEKLSSRIVDLIGDFAGSNVFIVEGDSLLRACFSDPQLDFDEGFQLLHAVFLVERFLQRLIERKCNFRVVFFENHRMFGVTPDTSESKLPRFGLSRAVIIRHLQSNVKNVEVKIFQDLQDHDFEQYVVQEDVYFFMAHDGASRNVPGQSGKLDTAQQRYNKLRFRCLIRHLIKGGYAVALVNELEWRDSKVMAHIIESRTRNKLDSAAIDEDTWDLLGIGGFLKTQLAGKADGKRGQTIEIPEDLQKVITNTQACLSERLVLNCLALKNIPGSQQFFPAYILHLVLLGQLKFSSRRLPSLRKHLPDDQGLMAETFLNDMSIKLLELLSQGQSHGQVKCDIADLVDGRLFFVCSAGFEEISSGLCAAAKVQVEALSNYLGLSSMDKLVKSGPRTHGSSLEQYKKQDTPDGLSRLTSMLSLRRTATGILPFSSEIFDKYLATVKLDVDVTYPEPRPVITIYYDITHWHSAKKFLGPKKNFQETALKVKKELRWNQFFMAEMLRYAESLTNAAGKGIEAQVIISKQKGSSPKVENVPREPESSKQMPLSGKQTAKPPKLNSKDLLRQKIAQDNAEKDLQSAKKVFQAWKAKRAQIEESSTISARYRAFEIYLENVPKPRQKLIRPEVRLCQIQNLLILWAQGCQEKRMADGYSSLAAAVYLLYELSHCALSKVEARCCQVVVSQLNIPLTFVSTDSKRVLSFEFFLTNHAQQVPIPWVEFMLLHYGPYMVRNLDSQSDSRVSFEPDAWQVKVLDEIDKNHSVFVVAPTSAGKTFISFYAMEQVLKRDDDGVLVYLAPTKTLVNQIAAEIQARFAKKYPHSGRCTWAVHTRDYRINWPTGCQILVTVPHVLQILLLSPENAKTWSPRIRRIIFDEIHCIGQEGDGLVWEQLLLLAPCPIIALSATVGNPTEFSDWMSSAQKSLGHELTMIEHKHRYSDLRKFKYTPPEKFIFRGFVKDISPTKLSLDEDPCFGFVHPITSLIGKTQLPDDMALEPRDCLSLWKAMIASECPGYYVPKALDPSRALPDIPKKLDIFRWERDLKEFLKVWMADAQSPFQDVLDTLAIPLNQPRVKQQISKGEFDERDDAKPSNIDSTDLNASTFPLLCSLHEQNALPTILFNYDRSMCESLCETVLRALIDAENYWKDKSSEWKRKLQGFEDWQKSSRDKRKLEQALQEKKNKAGQKKEEGKRDAGDSKVDIARYNSTLESTSIYENFDPVAPLDEFSFANVKKCMKSELADYVKQLQWKGISPNLIEALQRGVAIHHSGCNRKYRQIVEILFRRGFLRVVIATGTLALGINMPCVTTVFSGDSVFLTALNFRQASGRAGRRGFDLLGNVVFHCIDDSKMNRLLSSRLPDLSGHFPLTTTLVLRLFTLLHGSNQSPYAVKAIDSMLSQPRIYLGGQCFQAQVMHHLRFSIEYLRRQSLLSPKGTPINFAGLVSHLYHTEDSAFAFHALLKSGFFHEVSKDILVDPDKVNHTLMITLANIFGRRPFKHSTEELKNKVNRSPSVIFLPRLPKQAADILAAHDKETQEVFESYVQTYVDQHLESPDDSLPLSAMVMGRTETSERTGFEPSVLSEVDEIIPSLSAVKVRSPFAALSGYGDEFSSVHDLCSSVRSGVFLEESVIPKLGRDDTLLNAYLFDFWNHQDLRAIDEDNDVRRAEIWFLLNDFSLVLATIITSLISYIRGPVSEMDFLDLRSGAEIGELEKEEDTMEKSDLDFVQVSSQNTQDKLRNSSKGSTKKVLESWDSHDAEADREDNDSLESVSVDAEEGELVDGGKVGLPRVLKAFVALRADFDEKFKNMWA